MTTDLYSSIANGQQIEFDPATDVLSFDAASVSAADFVLSANTEGDAVKFSGSAKSFTLDGPTLSSLNASNVVFSDGSMLVNASLANQYSSSLEGTGHDDLLIGSGARLVIQLVGVNADGQQTYDRFSDEPHLSADGRFVVFTSTADLAGDGSLSGQGHVYLRDLLTGTTSLVSATSDGTPGNISSYAPAISANGRFVLFESWANNLVANDTNETGDLFLKDLQTGKLIRVNTSSTGAEAEGESNYMSTSVSADGRYVVFTSNASNLVSGDTNEIGDMGSALSNIVERPPGQS